MKKRMFYKNKDRKGNQMNEEEYKKLKLKEKEEIEKWWVIICAFGISFLVNLIVVVIVGCSYLEFSRVVKFGVVVAYFLTIFHPESTLFNDTYDGKDIEGKKKDKNKKILQSIGGAMMFLIIFL